MKKVLFIGAARYNEFSILTRSNYIFPDLLEPMCKKYQVSLLTWQLPEFAAPLLSQLGKKFSIQIIEIKNSNMYGATPKERWKNMVTEIASKIQPDIITNGLASLPLGEAMAYAAYQSNCRSIVRVAGDEIGVRIILGTYNKSPAFYAAQCNQELIGFLGAHRIIAISPWERKRIQNILTADTHKVQVCIRGVDLAHFVPRIREKSACKALRFLFIGRAAIEKGYDLVEEAAKIIYKINPQIEFLFVGNFEHKQIENRIYLEWVDVYRLPELYRNVDALILTPYSEALGQVVIEAMASGLPCILTKDIFFPIFSHMDDVLLVDLHVPSIVEAVLLLSTDKDLFIHLCRQSRKIAVDNFDRTRWQNRYLDILGDAQIEGNTILDRKMPTKHLSIPEFIEQKKYCPIKILLILPSQLERINMLEIYLFASALNDYVNLLVISNIQIGNTKAAHVLSKGVRVIDIDFSSINCNKTILKIFNAFNPDVVHIVSHDNWYDFFLYMKKNFVHAKYVLDIKCPSSITTKLRQDLVSEASKTCLQLDSVVAANEENATTLVDIVDTKMTYPLNNLIELLNLKNIFSEQIIYCYRFVYVGSFDAKHQLHSLIRLIAMLPNELLDNFSLDMYGSGNEMDALKISCKKLKLSSKIRILDILPQEELVACLTKYDAAIAWHPNENDTAELSSKCSQLASYGLVVLALDTQICKKNVAKTFEMILFSSNLISFSRALKKAMISGYPSCNILKNLKKVNNLDAVVSNYFIPAYEKLIQSTTRTVWAKQTLLFNEFFDLFPSNASGLKYERALHAKRMFGKILFDDMTGY